MTLSEAASAALGVVCPVLNWILAFGSGCLFMYGRLTLRANRRRILLLTDARTIYQEAGQLFDEGDGAAGERAIAYARGLERGASAILEDDPRILRGWSPKDVDDDADGDAQVRPGRS